MLPELRKKKGGISLICVRRSFSLKSESIITFKVTNNLESSTIKKLFFTEVA